MNKIVFIIIFSVIIALFFSLGAGAAYSAESDWLTQYAFLGEEHSLDTDSLGAPHIASEFNHTYSSTSSYSDISYASWTPEGWGVEGIDLVLPADAGLSMEIDGYDKPHIGYSTEFGSGIYYATKSESGWQKEQLRGRWTQNDVTLAVDNLNKPHVICGDNTRRQLQHFFKSGASWQGEFLDVQAIFSLASIAADSYNALHIIYPDPYAGTVYHIYQDGGSWATEDIGVDLRISKQALAVDSQDNIHVAGKQNSQIIYLLKDASGWHQANVTSPSIGNISEPTISVDSLGRPHIAYTDFYQQTVIHVWKDSENWYSENIFHPNDLQRELKYDFNYAAFPPYIKVDCLNRIHVTFNVWLRQSDGAAVDIFVMYARPVSTMSFLNPPSNPQVTAAMNLRHNNIKLVDVFPIAEGAKEMILSEDQNFAGASWEPYSPLRPYELVSDEDGEKTIYAKFRGDNTAVETNPVSCTFMYAPKPKAFIDSVDPAIGLENQTVSLSGHGTDNSGAAITGYEWVIDQINGDFTGELTRSNDAVFSFNPCEGRTTGIGRYKALFRVQNSEGKWSDEKEVVFIVWDGETFSPGVAAAYQHLYERMDLYQTGNTPRLVESYAEPYPQYTTNIAFIYDNALVVNALLARGTAEDKERAKLICRKLIELSRRDWPIRNSYNAINYSPYDYLRSTGNLSWAVIALMQYYLNSGEQDVVFLNSVLQTALDISNFIESYCHDYSHFGYTGGAGALWKSTEHNVDCYAAFTLLYKATNDSSWLERATWAKRFVTERAWSEKEGMYWVGSANDGWSLNTTFSQQAEDANSWSLLALGAEGNVRALDWVERKSGSLFSTPANPPFYFGFDFNTTAGSEVWFEGTAHMALAYKLNNLPEKYNLYINQLRKAQTFGPNGNGKGIVATPNTMLDTGHGFYYFPSLHIGATAWYLAAELGYNMFWGNPPARVTGRRIFYNNSAFDDTDDDNAIAPDKSALMPGSTATFANYTGYSRGINGIMVDIENIKDSDNLNVSNIQNYFNFKVGNSNSTLSWASAPLPSSVTVHELDSSTIRVKLIWPDGTIKKQWLEVRVLANQFTGLSRQDVFYFGNAVGECGNSSTDAKVNAFDMLLVRDNPRTFLYPADITFPYDFNRDERVNATDMLIARNNPTHILTALQLITPVSVPAPARKAPRR